MLRAFTVVALLALITLRADARLWETIAQTESRYGHALQKFPGDAPGEEQRKYRYKEFYILVTFLHGRSDDEKYLHTDGKTPFSEKDIQFFLKMNSGGESWQKSKELPTWTLGGSSVESWRAIAAYYPKGKYSSVPGLGVTTMTRAKKEMKVP